jgi:hypothetical protein
MLKQNQKSIINNLGDHLTFYHELQIPHNELFDVRKNTNIKNNLLIISSPSRMGNHLLLSALDNHPALPRTPGEDGFLSFSFQHANQDYYKFITSLRSSDNYNFITKLASNGSYNRWLKFKQLFDNDMVLDKHAGIGDLEFTNTGKYNVVREFVAQDYEGIVFDINYSAFSNHLQDNLSNIQTSKTYNEIFQIYLNSITKLDYKTSTSKYDSFIVASGMRTQLKWICMTYENVKILSSIRSFTSYAVSHIKSRYNVQEYTDDMINEAWEHWYHKVIDLLWLKIHFPNKIGLVLFEDMIDRPNETHERICRFLEVDYHNNMQIASAFGTPVRGNPSVISKHRVEGTYYKPKSYLEEKHVPERYKIIWSAVKELSRVGT